MWLARLRLYYSDRVAVETTGNSNGLVRALLKITIGISQDIQRQRQTSFLLESLDLLTPVGYQAALTQGSVYPHTSTASILEWDRRNPYRHWLAISNTHAPLGDRLNLLTLYARHWKLDTELDWSPATPSAASAAVSNSQPLLAQAAPYVGIPIGLLLAVCLWGLGGIARQLGLDGVSWLWGDRSILLGCLLFGFSFGTFLRINAFFPDIKSFNLQTNPRLPDLLSPADMLPINSQPVRLQGQLLGRDGISSGLNQDLFLNTATGLIRLHFISQLGPLAALVSRSSRPQDLLNQSVTVTGWFRRGATPWIDVETIQPQRGQRIQAEHPLWSTLLAIAAALLGTYIISQGAF